MLTRWFATCAFHGLTATVLFTGCADDTNSTAATGTGDLSTSTGESSSGEGSSTSAAPPSTSTGSSSGGSTDVESTGDSSGLSISGTVQDFGAGGTAIPGANIGVMSLAGVTAISADDGSYNLAPVSEDSELFVTLSPSASYLGSVVPLTTGTSDITDQPLTQISLATVTQQFDFIAEATDQTPDLVEHAVVIVRLLQNTATGATITMDPPPVPGTSYAPDATGTPIVDHNMIEFGLLPVLVYFNVPETEPGELTIMASHPERTCATVHPAFPTLAGYVTLVDIDCPAS